MPSFRSLITPVEQFLTHYYFQNLLDVTGAEFKLFIDFLKSLTLFGQKAPLERVQELVEIIEGQADLDAQFNVWFTSCTASWSLLIVLSEFLRHPSRTLHSYYIFFACKCQYGLWSKNYSESVF